LKFGFDSIILWSKNGQKRSLEFARNRVNVLSGESHTGKSALLDIIDYCFLASSHKLPDSIINENVSWYGLKFYVNDKTYTLARRGPRGNEVSGEYFFSSTGFIPEIPTVTTREEDIRKILEAEFHIDEKVTVAYGGKSIKANSKISFRYFFLFNTISEDIITNSKVFFDKQAEERYREALPRIFDIALGIDDLANIAARERKELLEKEMQRLERKNSLLSSGSDDFEKEVRQIALKAAEYGIFNGTPTTISREVVKRAINEAASSDGRALDRYEEASAELLSVERRLRKLTQFTSEYSAYKGTLKNAEDSLLPIDQLIKQAPTLIKSGIFNDLISALKADLQSVKKSTARKQPVDGQIGRMVRSLQDERDRLQFELTGLPQEPQSFASEREKWLFVGEAKGRLMAYESAAPIVSVPEPIMQTNDLQVQIDAIQIRDVDETRAAVISMINEIAQGLLTDTKNALANYSNYQTDFAYNEKRLRLRKPRSSLIENVGSSSNHMFLHLLQFLALHEVAISHKSPFVPQFLIIDQPSRPYYPDQKPKDNVVLTNSDSEKVSIAFQLLNDFVARINMEYNAEFQMIVFEHVPKDTFDGMDYVHLLPEFRNGEALIPSPWQSDQGR
jgi:PIN domain nuclease of toxin-antitoxin system